jgi:dynein heavy chain
MKAGLNDYANTERKKWVVNHAGQIVATVAQIMWCQSTEFYIMETVINPGSLNEWFEVNELQLSHLTELVRGKLSPLQRKIIVALVTTDVHARDIIENLRKEDV